MKEKLNRPNTDLGISLFGNYDAFKIEKNGELTLMDYKTSVLKPPTQPIQIYLYKKLIDKNRDKKCEQ